MHVVIKQQVFLHFSGTRHQNGSQKMCEMSLQRNPSLLGQLFEAKMVFSKFTFFSLECNSGFDNEAFLSLLFEIYSSSHHFIRIKLKLHMVNYLLLIVSVSLSLKHLKSFF